MTKKMYASFTMTPEAKREWVKALRSGKFDQGVGALFVDGSLVTDYGYSSYNSGYCCLGVLCKLQGVADAAMVGNSFPHEVGLFKDIDRDWSVPYKGEMFNLADLNDDGFYGCRLTFKQIANIIDRSVQTH